MPARRWWRCSPACRSPSRSGRRLVFMLFFMPAASLDTVTQNVYEEMASITLLSIPLFILKGAAIGKSRASRTSIRRCTPGCIACRRPRHRQRPGLRDLRFMAGSSPATCSAIGSAGIPEMRRRGYSGGFASGVIAASGALGILLPPSITMILYAVAANNRSADCFLAGIFPGLLLALFAGYAMLRYRQDLFLQQTRLQRHRQAFGDPRQHARLRWPSGSARCRASCLSSSC